MRSFQVSKNINRIKTCVLSKCARNYFKALFDDWEMLDFPTEKIVADGDTVVWIGRCSWRNKQDGKAIDTPKIDVWTFRNGKAVRFFEMFDSLGFARAASLI